MYGKVKKFDLQHIHTCTYIVGLKQIFRLIIVLDTKSSNQLFVNSMYVLDKLNIILTKYFVQIVNFTKFHA